MFLRKSTINDIKELTAISIKAFGSDIQVGGKEAGGPPDYDSESWHRKMMEQNHLYTFLNSDENIVVVPFCLEQRNYSSEEYLLIPGIFVGDTE